MYPRQRQNRIRAWTGNPWIAVILAFLLAAQTTVAMPHAHPAGDEFVATAKPTDHPTHEHHDSHEILESLSGSGHGADSRDCCEIECQDCAMGGCSSLTQSRGPGFFNDNRERRFSALDRLIPEPTISDLYRPPIPR